MRVIAGSARSIQLNTPPGNGTRPTTDKIKETLFNMLQFDLPGCLFLDLFAGSGGIGIEALSRGAAHAYFTDTASVPVQIIKENLRKCHLEDRATVIKGDALLQISRIETDRINDPKVGDLPIIAFLDPPYDKGMEFPVLKALADAELLDADSIVIVESSLKGDLSPALAYGYEVEREKIYKNQKHTFLRKATS